MKKILETSSNSRSYSADAGEPDTGWLPGDAVRMLGFESGKPEPWFHQLEFEQLDFPVADHIYGKGTKPTYIVTKSVITTDLRNVLRDVDADVASIKSNTKKMVDDLVRSR